MTSPFSWFVGIDWSSKSHQVCLMGADGSVRADRSFPHGGAGQAALARWLLDTTGAAPGQIAVAIETPRGPVVEGLLAAGVCVHAIGPSQIRGPRQRYSPSGAKDDRRDARMLARALRAHASGSPTSRATSSDALGSFSIRAIFLCDALLNIRTCSPVGTGFGLTSCYRPTQAR